MANLPTKFRKSSDFNVSYDFLDFDEGLGYRTYYAADGNNQQNLIVTNEAICSELPFRTSAAITTTPSWQTAIEEDFDITFNLPKNVRGTIFAVIPFGVSNNEAGSFPCRITATFIHFDGSSETVLGSGVSSEMLMSTASSPNEIDSAIALCKFIQTSVKHFKKGETLRVTIKMEVASQATEINVFAGIGIDPKNRNPSIMQYILSGSSIAQVIEDGDVTQTAFYVPFVLDI